MRTIIELEYPEEYYVDIAIKYGWQSKIYKNNVFIDNPLTAIEFSTNLVKERIINQILVPEYLSFQQQKAHDKAMSIIKTGIK